MCDSSKFFEGVWFMAIGLSLMIGSSINLYAFDYIEKKAQFIDNTKIAKIYRNEV